MNKEYKTTWIDALRSGNYKQGRYRLHTSADNSYCCLGVLLECTGIWNDNTFLSGNLSLNNQEFFGISDYNTENLISMNDDQNKTFPEIADYIEKNM